MISVPTTYSFRRRRYMFYTPVTQMPRRQSLQTSKPAIPTEISRRDFITHSNTNTVQSPPPTSSFHSHLRRVSILVAWNLGLYIVLVGVLVGQMMFFLYRVLPLDTPMHTGTQSFLALNPGLSLVPQPDHLTTLIQFKVRAKYSYVKYANDLTAFLHWYEHYADALDAHLMNCPDDRPTDEDLPRIYELRRYACHFDVGHGGPCNLNDHYGYDSGVPCVALKINPVFGWIPDLQLGNHTDALLQQVKGVRVRCEGRTPSDQELMGRLCYYDTDYPQHGRMGCLKHEFGEFKHWFFPYLRQSGYQSPLVFVQFLNITRSVVVMLECRLFAANNAKATVRFEMLVD